MQLQLNETLLSAATNRVMKRAVLGHGVSRLNLSTPSSIQNQNRASQAFLSIRLKPYLIQSRGGENKSPRILQSSWEENGQSNDKTYFRHDTLQHDAIPPPSNFSISIVDPLHYLGVTPTVQSAELLQGCKYQHSSM
jgi:hypothetical protein